MTANEFQLKAHTFAAYDKADCPDYVYPALGLAEEAGEVAGKYAKAIRDENGHFSEERKQAIKKELGDVMWFVAELSTLLGITLEEVMTCNIEKLNSRKLRNCINGSGDDR